MIEPKPTKRAVIDPLRVCNIRCKFCYYIHTDMKSIKPFDKVKVEIDAAAARGNNYIDVTGGEPFLYQHLPGLIKYAAEKGMKTCVITNALSGVERLDAALEAGVDDFLVSVHGLEQTHDSLVQSKGARAKQIIFLDHMVKSGINPRFNFVLNRYNQDEIFLLSSWLASNWHPTIINYINMNPHGEWASKLDEAYKVIADLRIVEQQLNKTIPYLEENNVGVNVRYYPMCRIAEGYRRCVCNDLHVVFDPYEWDYSIQPKSFDAFRKWGINVSNSVEHKWEPCKSCDLANICGGINKAFNRASGGKMLDVVKDATVDKNDFYYYRKHNVMALKEK